MNDRNLQTIERVRQFQGVSEAFFFRALFVGERYNWIEKVNAKRAEKGVIQ